MGMRTDWSERKNDSITIIVGGRGRNRYAHDMAERMLEPGEVADQVSASHPTYTYKARRVAVAVVVTPEERTLLDEALRTHLKYLIEGLRTASNESRELLMQEIAKVEKLHPKVRETP